MSAVSLDEQEILETIGDLIRTMGLSAADQVAVHANTRLIDELGFDSVSMLELLTAIEDKFDITIDFEELDVEVLNVAGSLASLVTRKVAA
jgi:acyl carrier protein